MTIDLNLINNAKSLVTYIVLIFLFIVGVCLLIVSFYTGLYFLAPIVLLWRNPIFIIRCNVTYVNFILFVFAILLATALFFFHSTYYYTDYTFLYMNSSGGGGGTTGGGGSTGPAGPTGPGGGVPNNHAYLMANTNGRDVDNHKENIWSIYGITNADDRAIRDEVIKNGYDSSVSQQPYARKLAARLTELKNGSKSPDELYDRDQQYTDIMQRHYWATVRGVTYDPQRHNTCTLAIIKYIRRLP